MADGPSTQVNDWQEVNDWQDVGGGASTPATVGDFRKLAVEAMARSGIKGAAPSLSNPVPQGGTLPKAVNPFYGAGDRDPVNQALTRTAANFADMAQHPWETTKSLLGGIVKTSPPGMAVTQTKQGIDDIRQYGWKGAPPEVRLNRAAEMVGVNGLQVAEDAAAGNYGGIMGEGATAALQLLLMKKAGEAGIKGVQKLTGPRIPNPKVIDTQASNLASAVERGSAPPPSVKTYEGVTRPVIGATRQVAAEVAAEKGINIDKLSGREMYQFMEEVTDRTKAKYDARFNDVLEKVKDQPLSDSARESAIKATDEALRKAEFLDEMLKGEHTDAQGRPVDVGANIARIKNIRAKISSSGTIGDYNELRVMLNELGEKGFSSDGSKSMTMAQQQFTEASNAVRNAEYEEIARHGVMPEADLRALQHQHGSAIVQRNMMRQTARAMSSSVSESQAGPSFWQNLRGQAAPFEVAGRPKLAATAVSRHIFKPVAQYEVFNTEVKRALKGATPPPPESTAKVQQSMLRDSFRKNMSRYTPPKQEVKPPDVWDKIESVRYMESDIAQLEREVNTSTDPVEHRQLQGRLDFLREKLAIAMAAAK